MNDWKFYLLLTIFCLMVQGLYAMLEMACVSFNKVRLQYYVSKHNKRAVWLSFLLNHPTLLFGTTLIGVNVALQLGSESSRRFYESLGVSPDWAPLTQVFIVLIFAEIAPMFTGRRYAEHVAMLGIPIIYFSSIILRPIITLLDLLCRWINKIIRSPVSTGLYLTREELQKVLEEREEPSPQSAQSKEFNTVVANIFSLKNKIAKELMQPLKDVQLVPSFCTVAEMRNLLHSSYTPCLPIYHRTPQNIIAVAYPRDLLRIAENKRIRDFARPPWFILEKNSILQILKQFRRNNQSVAVVLNDAGQAVGILTLDEIVDEVFGQSDEWMSFDEMAPPTHHVLVDRTFPGDTKLSDFNTQYQVHLEYEDVETLEELVFKALGHAPTKGETVRVDQFELTVEEAPLFGERMISVRTIY
jgi:CBS domain containing-hemolysin-like protein